MHEVRKTSKKAAITILLAELQGVNRRWTIITGVSWTLTIIFSLRAFQLGEVQTVAPLQALGVVLNVLVAFVLFKEREHRLQKLTAGVAVVAGAYLLTGV